METSRSADSTSQVQQIEESFSNLRLSPYPISPNLYNPVIRMQEQPIFNPSVPAAGLTAMHPHWLGQAPPTYPPLPMWFTTPSLNSYFAAAAAQQNHLLGPNMDLLSEQVKEMMTHPIQNFAIQKFIENADEAIKRFLLSIIIQTKFFLQRLCCDSYGTRVVQKLIESLIDRGQKNSLVYALRPDVLHLALNEIGRHVIIQCIRNFSDAENEPILREVARHVFAMGRHKSGYLVLTECVSCYHCGPNLALVLDRVAENALLLSHDQYGNYVVQHALDQNMPRLTSNILVRLKGNYAGLSASKYGSNVVEKCLKVSRRDQCGSIIEELLHSSHISDLVVHSYGNYVIQTSLTLSKNLGLEMQHRELLGLLRMNMGELKISPHGKRLIKWLSYFSR